MIGALILGIVAGFVARGILPGRQSMNFLLTILLGLAGAALGWLFFTALLGIGDDDAFDLGGLPGAIVGAVILLWGYERFVASRRPAAATAPERIESAERGGGQRRAGERRGGGQRGDERRRPRRDQPGPDV